MSELSLEKDPEAKLESFLGKSKHKVQRGIIAEDWTRNTWDNKVSHHIIRIEVEIIEELENYYRLKLIDIYGAADSTMKKNIRNTFDPIRPKEDVEILKQKDKEPEAIII